MHPCLIPVFPYRRGEEESKKAMRVYDMHTMLICIVGFGTLGHVATEL
jgi:hypothetical protein